MSVRRERKSTRRYLDPPSPERPRTATPSGTPRASRLAVLPVVGEHHPSGDATGAASPGKAGKRNGRIAVQGGGTEDAAAIAAPHGARDKTDEEDQVNEAWDDFAAEYFEVVEQLPLELHRNFALLRELDEQTQRHTADLLGLVKRYARERVEEAREVELEAEVKGRVEEAGIEGEGVQLVQSEAVERFGHGESGAAEGGAMQLDGGADGGATSSDGEAGVVEWQGAAQPQANETNGPAAPAEASSMQPALAQLPESGLEDAEAAAAAAAAAAASHEVDAAEAIDDDLMAVDSPGVGAEAEAEAASDAAAEAGSAGPVQPIDADASAGPLDAAAIEAPLAPPPARQPWTLLPEIGRVAQEMFRSADEKVSIAVAAYNSVDRHIRAIDAALAASSSILLGAAPGSAPSHHATAAGALPTHAGAPGAPVDPAAPLAPEEGTVVGLQGTGAGGRKRDRKRERERARERKRVKAAGGVAAEGTGQALPAVVEPAWEGGLAVNGLKIDPNEPKYCYCNGVSSGVMIACDNEDCPREWFHLDCLGLTSEPKGKWWCNDCRPAKKQKK